MSGMAQFLDFDMDSDEDFEETVQQGKVLLFFKKHSCSKLVTIILPQIFILVRKSEKQWQKLHLHLSIGK